MDGSNAAREFAAVAHGVRDAAAPLSAPRPAPAVGLTLPRPETTDPSTVFVSWAHTATGWTDAETQEWARQVAEFTGKLRAFGLDADVDLFHTNESQTDWTRFGPHGVESSNFVIIAMSAPWAERWSGKNSPTEGAGAVGEADTLHGLFTRDQDEWQRKVMIALLPSKTRSLIPLDMKRVNSFEVDPDDPASFDGLLRTITEQPLYVKPAIGTVPVLPPTVTRGLLVSKSRGQTEERKQYLALREQIEKYAQDPDHSEELSILQGLLDSLA